MTENNIIQPFIKHDDNASQDGKILRMCLEFRKMAKTMSREELESFVSHGAYAIFWRILEFMKSDNLYIDDVELLSDNLRVDKKYIDNILNNFELFRIRDEEYISDRLLRDLKRQEEKANRNKKSAQSRWLISDFAKEYEKVFGIKPELSDDEIEVIKSMNKKIPEFKQKLPAIFSVLSKIKFDTKTGFIPRVDWLLKENHLREILNGQYGELKVDTSKDEREQLIKARNRFQDKIDNFDIDNFSTKSEAVDFIITDNIDRQLPDCCQELMEKFDITKEELSAAVEKRSTHYGL